MLPSAPRSRDRFYLLFTRDKISDAPHEPTNVYATLSDSLFSQITLLLGDFDVDLLSLTYYPLLVKGVFVVSILFLNIIMLNLLIAIMGDSYDRVSESRRLEQLQQKARVLLEVEMTLSAKQRRDPNLFPRWIHILAPQTQLESGWIGRIGEIKNAIKRVTKGQTRTLSQNLKKMEQKVSSLHEKMDGLNERLEAQTDEMGALLRTMERQAQTQADFKNEIIEALMKTMAQKAQASAAPAVEAESPPPAVVVRPVADVAAAAAAAEEEEASVLPAAAAEATPAMAAGASEVVAAGAEAEMEATPADIAPPAPEDEN